MTKQTKTIAMVLGLGAIGYWVFSRNKAGKSLNPFSKSSSFDGEDFFNASGRKATRLSQGGGTPTPTCGDGCDNGSCYVPVYDANGDVTYSKARCGGGAGSGMF